MNKTDILNQYRKQSKIRQSQLEKNNKNMYNDLCILTIKIPKELKERARVMASYKNESIAEFLRQSIEKHWRHFIKD